MSDDKVSPGQHKIAGKTNSGKEGSFTVAAPTISLPRGGGAIKSIDEKFSVNAINGTSAFSIPVPFSSARGYSPSLSLAYNSGSGNGIFGMGWQPGIASIKRRTDKMLPRYIDANDTDTFVIAGAEDLVPEYKKDNTGAFIKDGTGKFTVNEYDSPDNNFLIRRYRPRIEGMFARIERWQEKASGIIHWQVVSGDNVTTVYGKTLKSRIADPADPLRIFEWLVDFSYDDKGHCTRYEYIQETGAGIDASLSHNRNRINGNAPFTNSYLKRIWYGNVEMYEAGGPVPSQYMFENVFDYGEHDTAVPFAVNGSMPYRSDAFSEYRAGFEIRTCRLCRNIILYHHFKELPGGSAAVKALQLEYDDNGADGFTFLRQATLTGFTKHDDGSYTSRSMPPMTFRYSKHNWNENVEAIGSEDLVNAPVGISEPLYQFTDLYSEGLSGILSEQAGELFYKSNLGNGHFTAASKVNSKPSYTGIASGVLQLADLEANGIKQLVSWHTPAPGFFELDTEAEWQPYTAFRQVPNINQKDANTKLIDLNGDGKPDLLISEDDIFTWYPSKGKQGYGEAQKIIKGFDEEKGPAVIFADSTQSIFLSNMSGGGMSDIVRIRNGEICYWPNLGYGRFGAKVNMDNAPVFDHPDAFNPSMIKLADIDGSGTTDLLYLGRDSISIWFNCQGNSIAPVPKIIAGVPEINQQTKITITDLLGTGLSCIVWSSVLPKHQGKALQYIDLLKSEKPHIMIRYDNNLGKEVHMEYKPSTAYYIADKLAGKPWITKLHFPVQCVSKVITYDRILKTRFATEYSYHHGYYDHEEKEFRGFGRVDQQDAEDIAHFIRQSGGAANNIEDATLHQEPVLTRSWFHTGAFLDRQKITDQFAHEYFQNTSVPEKKLPSPELPATLTTDEWRQALRACKGTLLRKEVYALDGKPEEAIPYAAEEHNIMISMLQPAEHQPYAVFHTHESEAVNYHYERNPADARVSNNFVLETDDFGNVLKSAAVVYKRNTPAAGTPANEPEQETIHFTCTESMYTKPVDDATGHRHPAMYEERSYHLGGFPAFAGYPGIALIRQHCNAAAFIDYQADFTTGLQKRLIEFTRSQYRGDDGVTVLPFGDLQSKGLKHQDYKAAFNQPLLQNIFSPKIAMPALHTALTDPAKGGYIFSDNYYWIPSGTVQYDTARFFLTTAATDPLGNTNTVEYDNDYALFITRTTDPLNNTTQLKTLSPGKYAFNYRTLSAYIMQDANDNETAARYDEMGMVVRSFIIGKKGTDAGDEIDESKTELKGAVDQPTGEMEYSTHDWYDQVNSPGFDIADYKPRPTYVKSRSRETHYHADPAHNSKWHENYTYTDGDGHEVLKKSQAEAGEALEVQADGTVIMVDTGAALRWIGNGRSILNNKGNPVKKYEPYFSTSPGYDDEKEMVELGVTPVIEYDPLDRVIKTTNPDKTFTTVVFTAWLEKNYDANDTVMDSGWYIDRGSPNPLGPEPADAETRAAWLAAKHYDTPSIKHIDTLGRTFLTIVDNKTETLETRLLLDIEGNELRLTDALGRPAMEYRYGMLGNKLKQTSIDAGSRWTISNVLDKPLLAWDDMDHAFSYAYDTLLRPVSSSVRIAGGTPLMYERSMYGESLPPAVAKVNNLRGKINKQYDQSGLIQYFSNDFKGNSIHTSKTFTVEYKATIDWTAIAAIALQADEYESRTEFDAMNRPVKITTPHTPAMQASQVYPLYNEANLLNRLEVTLRGATARTIFVEDINYNAKGEREDILYGNKTRIQYTHDRETLRLMRLNTTRNAGTETMQDINYTYDAAGHITQISDEAQEAVFFDGELVKALNKYEYDAVNRLIKATGRKHAGQTDINHNRPDFNYRNHPFIPSPTIDPSSATAFRNYTEAYTYDKANNLLEQKHTAKKSAFTRMNTYEANNNRLSETNVGLFSFKYIDTVAGIDYDAHGNMSIMEQVQELVWNFKDELHHADLGGGGDAWYVYGNDKNRVRKVVERPNGDVEERIYLGILEVYRKSDSAGNTISSRETLHIMDNKNRVALVDTPVVKKAGSTETQLLRYQYSNHINSSSLELDDTAKIISSEEYFPFGTTSYYTVDATREIAAKQYRYTGKERDSETGLNYHGTRYYAPWLCRWTAADPTGVAGGINLYAYGANNPVSFNDPSGNEPHPAMNDGLLRPDPNGAQLPGLTRMSIPPFQHPDEGDWGSFRPNYNFRTVFTSGPGARPSVDIPTQFTPGGIFIGTGDTKEAIFVHPSLRGSSIASSVRGDHFRQFTSMTGSAPRGFSVDVANRPTVEQLSSGMDFRRTLIGRHIAAAARPLGLRMTGVTTSGYTTHAGTQNYFAQGNFSYQPIRARLDGIAASMSSAGRSAMSSMRNAGTSLRNTASRVASTVRSPGAAITAAGGGAAVARTAAGFAGNLGRATLSSVVRMAVPGAAEVMDGVAMTRQMGGARVVARMAVQPVVATVRTTAAAVAGAPAAAAGIALTAGVVGGVTGDFVESRVTAATGSRAAGVASGTLAGAATGALVGAAIGSVVPGIGTAAGAVIGGVAGAVGGFIGSYW